MMTYLSTMRARVAGRTVWSIVAWVAVVLAVASCGAGEDDPRDEQGVDVAEEAERYELVLLDSVGVEPHTTAEQPETPEETPAMTARPETSAAAPPAATDTAAGTEEGSASPVVMDPDGAFVVQVGSYRDLAGAEQVVRKLKDEGYPAYRIAGPEGKTYRVRIGFFRTRDEAERFGAVFYADRQMEYWVDRRQDGE